MLAGFDETTGRLTIRMSTQMPSGVRDSVCDALGLAEGHRCAWSVGDVGGGFGMKTGVYPEDIAVAYAARALQRPVKWVADRSEEFVSTSHGRDIAGPRRTGARRPTARSSALRLQDRTPTSAPTPPAPASRSSC